MRGEEKDRHVGTLTRNNQVLLNIFVYIYVCNCLALW